MISLEQSFEIQHSRQLQQIKNCFIDNDINKTKNPS